jgi:hypothetical protein
LILVTYLQGPEASLTEFVHHLQAYLPLFRQLTEFGFLYLARVDSHFGKAKELFDSTMAIPLKKARLSSGWPGFTSFQPPPQVQLYSTHI